MEKKIAKIIVGSHMFGLNGKDSDLDTAEIYMCDPDELFGLSYKEHDDIDKDTRRYEVGKFVKLLIKGNPNMLEILNAPAECILESSPEWKFLVKNKDMFVTKRLYHTFTNYASTQLMKAQGLNKKINWEKEKTERRDVLDFCFVLPYDNTYFGSGLPLKPWLQKEEFKQEWCGLVAIDHFRQTYWLYVDELEWVAQLNHRFDNVVTTHEYKGIVQNVETSNDVSLSSVPAYCVPKGQLYFNKDAYSIHCKDYASYQKWLRERNENRYNTNKNHGQDYDSKNVMHLMRLMYLAQRIALSGEVKVKPGPIESKTLLDIKSGNVDLKNAVQDAQILKDTMRTQFETSGLPEEVDEKKAEELLVKLRKGI